MDSRVFLSIGNICTHTLQYHQPQCPLKRLIHRNRASVFQLPSEKETWSWKSPWTPHTEQREKLIYVVVRQKKCTIKCSLLSLSVRKCSTLIRSMGETQYSAILIKRTISSIWRAACPRVVQLLRSQAAEVIYAPGQEMLTRSSEKGPVTKLILKNRSFILSFCKDSQKWHKGLNNVQNWLGFVRPIKLNGFAIHKYFFHSKFTVIKLLCSPYMQHGLSSYLHTHLFLKFPSFLALK